MEARNFISLVSIPIKTVCRDVYDKIVKKLDDDKKDTTDVFYVEAQGKTRWIVYENNISYEYILEPGDMIFVPASIYHEIKPITPRVGISIGFN